MVNGFFPLLPYAIDDQLTLSSLELICFHYISFSAGIPMMYLQKSILVYPPFFPILQDSIYSMTTRSTTAMLDAHRLILFMLRAKMEKSYYIMQNVELQSPTLRELRERNIPIYLAKIFVPYVCGHSFKFEFSGYWFLTNALGILR